MTASRKNKLIEEKIKKLEEENKKLKKQIVQKNNHLFTLNSEKDIETIEIYRAILSNIDIQSKEDENLERIEILMLLKASLKDNDLDG